MIVRIRLQNTEYCLHICLNGAEGTVEPHATSALTVPAPSSRLPHPSSLVLPPFSSLAAPGVPSALSSNLPRPQPRIDPLDVIDKTWCLASRLQIWVEPWTPQTTLQRRLNLQEHHVLIQGQVLLRSRLHLQARVARHYLLPFHLTAL